jgi:hypothetical protein
MDSVGPYAAKVNRRVALPVGPHFRVSFRQEGDHARRGENRTDGEEQAPTQVNVVWNWFEELKCLVPVSR